MAWQGAAHIERALRSRGARTSLAKALGKDPASITRWISGVRPDPALWPAIEQHLGLEPGTLGDSVSSPVDERLDRIEAQLATMHAQLESTAQAVLALSGQLGIVLETLSQPPAPPTARRKGATGARQPADR